MRVEWLPTTERNREDQLTYVGERNKAATDMGDAIDSAVQRLAEFPHAGRLGRVAGTRELTIAGTPYLIACRLEPGAVVILRLLHGATVARCPLTQQPLQVSRR